MFVGGREDRAEKRGREGERKRENASCIYINSLLLRASHISDILARSACKLSEL